VSDRAATAGDGGAAPRAAAAAISCVGVSKTFRRGTTEVRALDQVDLEVADGEAMPTWYAGDEFEDERQAALAAAAD